jgi:hypothetical protein
LRIAEVEIRADQVLRNFVFCDTSTGGVTRPVWDSAVTTDLIDVNSKVHWVYWPRFRVEHSLHITRLPPQGPFLQ